MFDSFSGYVSGILKRKNARKGIRVFSYHGVVEKKKDQRLERNFQTISDFRAHVDFLKRFKTLSLNELRSCVLAKRIPSNTAMITFDDGFKNNEIAFEILKKNKMLGTVFISTGAVSSGGTIWTEELALLILFGNAEKLDVLETQFSLKTRLEKESAYQQIRLILKTKPADEKDEAMQVIKNQFPKDEVNRLLEEYPSMKMLSWEEIAQWSSMGVEIGSHGVNHEIHHSRQPEDVRMDELVRSKQEIEAHTKQTCSAFAYPNGDYFRDSKKQLKEAGYEMAFTTTVDSVEKGSDLFYLPRMEPAASLKKFAEHFYWK